jgi:hypothetical protein
MDCTHGTAMEVLSESQKTDKSTGITPALTEPHAANRPSKNIISHTNDVNAENNFIQILLEDFKLVGIVLSRIV